MQDEYSQYRAAAPSDSSADSADAVSRKQLERIVTYLEVQLADLDRREQELNGERAALDSERRSLRRQVQQFEERVEQHDEQLRQREQSVTQRESEQQLLRDQLRQELERVARERERLSLEQSEFQEERSVWRGRCEQEMAQQRQELDRRDADINRRTLDVAKRARFHEEHLKKLRRDVERQRSELTAEAQRQQAARVRMEEQFQHRLKQIRRYRELLEQRDAAINVSGSGRVQRLDSDAA